jgi:aldehyde dehydrogenase (NAD+)
MSNRRSQQPAPRSTTARPDQFKRVSDYVGYGIEDGAHLGKPFAPDGLNGKDYYYLPTIFTGATNEIRIARDEIFGPVLTVIPFDTEDEEAIRLANDTDYGLASGIHTLNLKRAHRVARALRAGTVWVNTYNMFDATTPFGGYTVVGVRPRRRTRSHGELHAIQVRWIDLS